MVVISTRCVFMVDTCGPGVVSSTYDMLEISVVHGVRGVGGVCEMCMCLAQCWVGGVVSE